MTRDVEFERSEYFTLKLYTSTTFVILSPNTATVNIADGDGELAGHSIVICMELYIAFYLYRIINITDVNTYTWWYVHVLLGSLPQPRKG